MINKIIRIEDNFGDCPDNAMDYIADMLGTGFRDKMIATMGGLAIKVPVRVKTLRDDHPLVQNLGRIDAEEIVALMPGEIITIPNPRRSTTTQDAVAALVLAGKTSPQIARELGITDRQVRRLRGQAGLAGTELAKRLGVTFQKLADAIKSNPNQLPAPQ